jgi:outer membrane receptor for ferrienterochelin and colicins
MRKAAIIFSILFSISASAQDSTFSKSLDEIVITATRTERKLGNVAIPTQIVSRRIIQLSGSLRLNDILQEQTGIFIISGSGSGAVGGGVFGNGIQLQGLSPDHTMILLDGEPLIGRQGGVMDLSRFAIGNIKKIEIVKGPSSSLYGSEAMGGVINIITEPLQGKQFNAGIRSGSFLNTDVYASGNYTGKKAAIYFFANRNSSNGYELDKTTPEKTLDPYYNYTGHLKFSYRFSPKTKLILNNRYFFANQKSFYAINNSKINICGKGTTNDFNINPVLTHKFSNKISSQLRFLISDFRFTQQLDSLSNNKQYYYDDFRQGFYRAENQTDIELNKYNTLTVGGGYTLQTVNTTRYREEKEQHLYYGFIQNEWHGVKKLIVIGGFRYDYNTAFKARISPKVAVNYKLNEKIKFNTSYGAGFKAPDFRQLYLSFVNNAAEGYSIYGANEFSIDRLEQQKQQGFFLLHIPSQH